MSDTPDTLPAGRELDAEVAEKVMGWRWIKLKINGVVAIFSPERAADWISHNVCIDVTGKESDFERASDWDRADCLPAYSTEPAAMMRVVEVLRERFGVVEMSGIGNQWFCRVRGICEHGDAARSETLPLAVARAALAAVKESPCP